MIKRNTGSASVGARTVRLTLMRHAEPDWMASGVADNDPPLSENGVRQAKALDAELLDRGYVFNGFVTSGMRRSYQTGEVLAGRDLCVSPAFNELGAPTRWEGGGMEEVVKEVAAFPRRSISEMWDGWEGGESIRSLKKRVRREIASIFKEFEVYAPSHRYYSPLWQVAAGEPTHIGVVGHKMVNAYILSFLLAKPSGPFDWLVLASDFVSITELELIPVSDGYAWRLVSFNDVNHLLNHGIPLCTGASHGS